MHRSYLSMDLASIETRYVTDKIAEDVGDVFLQAGGL
jgi:hypothetical protein